MGGALHVVWLFVPGLERRPEDEPAEQREAGRHERDGDGEGDGGRERQCRAEGAEELQLADDERRGPGDDDQAGRRDNGSHRRARPPRRISPRLATGELTAARGEEEDGVVGDDTEGERDDEGLHLLRDLRAEPLGDPGNGSAGDEEGDRGGDEREEGSAEGAERQADDEGDRQDGSQLHPREGLVDLLELRQPRGARPGDAGEMVADGAGGVVMGELDPVRQAHPGGEEEMGDRGRAVLLRAREDLLRVQDRQREQDLVALRLLRGGVDGPLDDRPLRLGGEPVGVSLDHCGVRRERDREVLLGTLGRLDGRRVVRDQSAELEGLARPQARQVQGRGDGSPDPRDHHEVTQPHER